MSLRQPACWDVAGTPRALIDWCDNTSTLHRVPAVGYSPAHVCPSHVSYQLSPAGSGIAREEKVKPLELRLSRGVSFCKLLHRSGKHSKHMGTLLGCENFVPAASLQLPVSRMCSLQVTILGLG
jgi:hypothetical protein